jgi:hypothetical protein
MRLRRHVPAVRVGAVVLRVPVVLPRAVRAVPHPQLLPVDARAVAQVAVVVADCSPALAA